MKTRNEKQAFWMVYGVGQRAPTRKHLSEPAAEQEAVRLAQANPGIEFVVLEAKAGFRFEQPMQRTTYVDYPF